MLDRQRHVRINTSKVLLSYYFALKTTYGSAITNLVHIYLETFDVREALLDPLRLIITDKNTEIGIRYGGRSPSTPYIDLLPLTIQFLLGLFE